MEGVRTGEQGGPFFSKVLNKHKKNPFFYFFAYQIFQFASDATVLKLKKGKKKKW